MLKGAHSLVLGLVAFNRRVGGRGSLSAQCSCGHSPRESRLRFGPIRGASVMAATFLAALFVSPTFASPPWIAVGQVPVLPSIAASRGCSMAHCDPFLSDNTHLTIPAATSAVALWHDPLLVGSLSGLGCSSNGTVAVCSFISTVVTPTLTVRAYQADGAIAWSSSLLGKRAWTSAPLVDSSGGAIVTGTTQIARYDSNGNVVWTTTMPAGVPTSPSYTQNGAIVLATMKGPISAYDVNSGIFLGLLKLNATINDGGRSVAGYFDTTNTLAVRGNRMYIVTQFEEGATGKTLPYGRLYAIDLVRRPGALSAQFVVAWAYEFRAPSGASPTIIDTDSGTEIIYDEAGAIPGAPTSAPIFVAVRDAGSSSTLVWSYPMPTQPLASAVVDPRGGIWLWSPGSPNLIRIANTTGNVLQKINLSALDPDGASDTISSAATLSVSPTGDPHLILGVVAHPTNQAYVEAINLATGLLDWRYRIDDNPNRPGVAHGQFPVARTPSGASVVIFSTEGNGVWGIKLGG
jgi:hypothetical protein